MAIINGEDVIAWVEDQKIFCTCCGDSGGDKPLTEENFVDTDIVICDSCGERIL
jgi:hypothetical protein